ncbi:MAG: hypothetical protein NC348_13270 [Clostridium sp.]|nr:hypothetical protein [Clostridium sp.]
MASGDLFHGYPLRFSMKKGQHVKVLEKFEDRKLNNGKPKNQVIIDALERYYDEMESENDASGDEVVTVKLLEQKLIQFRQGFRDEMMQELLRVFISSVAGQQAVVPVPAEEPEPAAMDMEEDDTADISGMPDVMEKIMGWSEN